MVLSGLPDELIEIEQRRRIRVGGKENEGSYRRISTPGSNQDSSARTSAENSRKSHQPPTPDSYIRRTWCLIDNNQLHIMTDGE